MGNRRDEHSSRRSAHEPPRPDAGATREEVSRAFERGEGPRAGEYRDPRGYAYPREGADNVGGYPREGGFSREQGFGHVPGQRWGGGYGGDVDRGREGPSVGRGFPASDFGSPRDRHPEERHFGNEVDRGTRSGYGPHGTDLGVGSRDPIADRGPHYGKGPKGYKRSDTRIHDEVCEAIAHQGDIDASDVEVKVTDGIVTLSGTVMHRHDKKGLEHLVEHTRGVDEVRNEIRLRRHETRERTGPGDVSHKDGKTMRS